MTHVNAKKESICSICKRNIYKTYISNKGPRLGRRWERRKERIHGLAGNKRIRRTIPTWA